MAFDLRPTKENPTVWDGCLVDGLDERLRMRRATPRIRTLVAELPADADLRTVALPGKFGHEYERGRVLAALLCNPGNAFDHHEFDFMSPFAHGVPLGPLATKQVYSTTESHGWSGNGGVVHASGHCRYSHRVSPSDDLLTLGEWLVRYLDLDAERWHPNSPLCSHCGGFSVRLLTQPEAAFLILANEVDQLQQTMLWHEDRPSGQAWPGEALTPETWERAIDDLEGVLAGFADVRSQSAPLAAFCDELTERAEVLVRRLRLRRDSA